MKVHLCNEEEREARSEIAAALAESARQLAQSAANFDQEELEERQRKGWHSKSLPHNSSLPYRTSLGTTHSLPLHSNKRKMFSSYSSTNLPPHGREHVYTPNLPSSGHTPPMASLDRPRHTVSTDHPNATGYHAYDNYKRNGFGYHPTPPESPLNSRRGSRLSSPSGRSLSSSSEYAPGHYHNGPLPPVHMRPHRLLSRRVSEPGGVNEGVYQHHNPVFLGHVHSGRVRSVNGSNPLAIASLDFNSPKPQSQKTNIPRLNGMTNPALGNQELRSQLLVDDVGFRHDLLEVGGMRNENGSDSNNSTLCGSSHSSTLDNNNRLSRVSEKSEHNENENDNEQKDSQEDNGDSKVKGGDQIHRTQEVDPDLSSKQGHPPMASCDEGYLTRPGHYEIRHETLLAMDTPTSHQNDTENASRQSGYKNSPLTPSSSQEMVSYYFSYSSAGQVVIG